MTSTASQVHPCQVKSSLTVTMEDEIGELRRLIVSKLEELILSLTLQARRKWGGAGSPPSNLLKFVDFVSEKGSESQDCRNEDLNSHIFEEGTRIYQTCNIF